MTDQPVRPRVTLGAVLALVGASLLMATTFAFPLALLLIGARPATRRLRIGAALALCFTIGWMVLAGTEEAFLLLQHSAAIIGGTTFVLLMRSAHRPALECSLLATGAALAVGIAGIAALGIDLGSARADFYETMLRNIFGLNAAIPATGLPRTSWMAFNDAGAVLTLIAGQCVAWSWYRIVADPTDLPAPVPFAEFRFSDHLIWLFVLGLLGVVSQIAGKLPQDAGWPGALLAVMTILYSVRGVAVLWPKRPTPLLLPVGVAVLFLPQIALPGLLGLGLADTWLDFRRRAAAASGE